MSKPCIMAALLLLEFNTDSKSASRFVLWSLFSRTILFITNKIKIIQQIVYVYTVLSIRTTSGREVSLDAKLCKCYALK